MIARRPSPVAALGLLLLIGCARSTTPAAQPAASLDPHQRGQLLLERSIRALGGRDAVLGLDGYELDVESYALRGNPLQARVWTDTTPNPIPGIMRYVVDLGRARVLHEFLTTSPGPIRFNYRSRYDSSGVWQVDLMRWRTGDDLVRAPAAAGTANLAAHERLIPQGALRQVLTRGDSIQFREHRAARGSVGAADVVSYVERRTRTRVDLVLDSATAVPMAWISGGTSWEWSDYRTVGATRVPYVRRQLANGVAFQEFRTQRVSLRPSLTDARFDPPAGFAPPPPPAAPVATKVAGGVYRFDNMASGYHAAFVVRAQDVVILEAPSDASFTETALKLIGEIAPGLPITHVFVTHHHNDHVGGLGPYVARGARLVVGAGLEEAIRRQLPDSLKSRVTFEPVTVPQTFGSGAGSVQAFAVPNGHAASALAFYLPAERVLFQGDLFYIPERGAVPPAFTVTDSLVKVVKAAGMTIDHVIGVHGRTGMWAEVEESIRRRADSEVFLNINPSWSPDGRQLVFESRRHGRASLYVINADGTGERRLTSAANGEDTHPAWSPDGSTIVFDSDRGGVWNLYTIRPDGTGERRLTNPGTTPRKDFARHPSWSPDGRRIAFDSDRDGDGEIYLMDADGSNATRLTNSPRGDSHASWSHDGRRIYFDTSREGNSDIWSMAADGSDARALHRHPSTDAGARVSRDGTRIIFFSTRYGNGQLFMMNADGSDVRGITPPASTSYEVDWSPDGRRVAFYSNRTGRFELWLMDADGSNQRQLTR